MTRQKTNEVAWGIAAVLAVVLLGSSLPMVQEAGWQPSLLGSGEQGFGFMGVSGKGMVRETFRLGVVGLTRWRALTPAELRADPLASGP